MPAVKKSTTWVERVTAATAVLGIVIALLSGALAQWNQVSTGRDTAAAIGQMAAIANAMKAEKPALERQADAAADSAKAANATAQLAKGQTAAIVDQARALIGSADATVKATNAQLAAAQAQLGAADAISDTAVPVARISGVAFETFDAKPNSVGLVIFGVRPFFNNAGSVQLLPGTTRFNLLFARTLPEHPPLGQTVVFGGNEVFVMPGNGYSPPAIGMTVSAAMRDMVVKHELKIFAWGQTEYSGPRGGKQFRECFVVEIGKQNMNNLDTEIRRIDRPAYRC